jgi:hypothetical protein
MAIKFVAPIGLTLLLAWVIMARPYDNWPPIRSDGVGYHVWVNGFLSRDLSFCRYRQLLEVSKAIAVLDERRSVCGIKYPPGVALLQLPFVSPWADPRQADGFPREVHAMVLGLGSGLLLLTATFSYMTLRRLDVSPILAQAVVGVFVFGTGLFHYATYDASFSHIYSACGIALLLWLLTVAREIGWKTSSLGLFGLATFWLYTVRQTNGLLTLLIAGIAVVDGNRQSATRIGLIWICATASALLLQVAYNEYVTGTLTAFSYGSESFDRWGARFSDVWFSYERGLATYYPIMIVTVVLSPLCRDRLIGIAFVVALTAYAFLYGSWHSWMLGHGMGHRGFIEVAPLGMMVFGCAVKRLQTKWKRFVMGVSGACVYVTLQIMVGYWRGSYPSAGADGVLYWRHLLHPTGNQVAVAGWAVVAVVVWASLAAARGQSASTATDRVSTGHSR